MERPTLELPDRPASTGYVRTDKSLLLEVPDHARTLNPDAPSDSYADPEDS
ncbi:MAG: hypothetical protein ACK5LS_07585 [Propioniciclava sp.]